ncbi:ABC transporter permease [Microbacterium jiangjiandongii]|uniref:ABC transporter permease n=1 Tax=Microbacterium jiangjiandongii TaxID=3049071 RepID=UPI00214B38F1|nr:ABC transporter permease [Microbacterium sp. zg.Y843]MCR2815017.1 ABC transporter permease [Microbacterium sp. zg.Y843]
MNSVKATIVPASAAPTRRVQESARRAAWFISPFLVLIALWAIVVPLAGVSPRTFPSIGAVVATLGETLADGTLLANTGVSLMRVLVGAGLAMLVGIPFGILMGMSKAVSGFFEPLLRFSVALAGIAWIPIATLAFGYGEGAVIFIVFNAVLFAIVYQTLLGVRQIPISLLRAARSNGASSLRMFFEVYLPGAMPGIAVGARTGMGFAWRGLIAAEIIATSLGLGYTLFLARQYYETDVMILVMIVIGVLWLIMDRLVLVPIERRTIQRWGGQQGVDS